MIALEILDKIIKKVHKVLNGFIQFFKQTKDKIPIILSYFIQGTKMEEFLQLDPKNGLNNKDGLSLKTFLYLMFKLKLVYRIWEAFKFMMVTSYLWLLELLGMKLLLTDQKKSLYLSTISFKVHSLNLILLLPLKTDQMKS